MKMKRFLTSILAGIMLICFMLSLCGCFAQRSEEEIARDMIQLNTKIEVPTNSEIVYHLREESEGFVHGRDFQYTVFQFETEPTEWLNENMFSLGKSTEFEKFFLGGLKTKPSEMEEIPQKFLPSFEEDYLWLMTDECIDFYFNPQKLFLIVQLPSN